MRGGTMATLPTLIPLAVFSLWTLASFLCHKSAKLAMAPYVTDMTSITSVVIPLGLTLVQTLCCRATVQLTSLRDPLFYVMAASHFLATWATNTSLALTFASSTMAVKMLEPVTSALLQRVVLKTAMGAEGVVGMVVVVLGAMLYVGNPMSSSQTSRAVLMALLSNVTLGVRNVALKLNHGASPATSRLRSPRVIATFAAAAAGLVLFTRSFVLTDASVASSHAPPDYFLLLSLASGACHVTYSYVSTNVVLRYMSVVSHAILNIVKRVLVVVLLHVAGRRSASMWNWAGLALCTVGLLLYSREKILSPSLDTSVTSTPHGLEGSFSETDTATTPGRPKIYRERESLLGRLLILLFVFVICLTSGQPLMTQMSRFQLIQKPRELHGFESTLGKKEFISPVLRSDPRFPSKSKTNYAQNLRFGHVNWTDGKVLIAGRIVYQPDRKTAKEVEEFVSRDNLLTTPFDTDGLSPYLTTSQEVIAETKRVHDNLFTQLFRGKKYAVVFDLASHENKGDAAITIGELIMLENMGIEILFFINLFACNDKNFQHALKLAQQHSMDEVVVLMHGGGNIFGYAIADGCRDKALKLFPGYRTVLFSQSIYMNANQKHFDFARNNYCCNPNLTLLMRDRLSLHIARRLFANGTHIVLAPDMAFQLGHVARFAPPYYDVIWQRRADEENPLLGKVPKLPGNVTTWQWDWVRMSSLKSSGTVKQAVNAMHNGLVILQQGRVLVTDRLHGHILSVLLNIPHVLLDNCHQKLSSYHNTWTRGLKNCRLADNAEDAARYAMELLKEYGDSLPRRLTAADIKEQF
ncbi:uncharacterized protein [Littorina saxatilis]|uniref:Polysaccharide pyruvyl transferase domain-containing protein n=1 Tax=Littorina saxatilis TaxID=31220 RepID=A0AAN9AQ94_9CAEN